MGTRSTYRFIEKSKEKAKKLSLVYFQYDGYPTGHPMDTAKWLSRGKVVNGFGIDSEELIFNGIGCLTAQFIASNKKGVGGVYIQPLDNRGHLDEEYTYDVIIHDDKTIEMIAYEIDWNANTKKIAFKKLFQGSPSAFIKKFENQ